MSGCASKAPDAPQGNATISGQITGVSLAAEHGYAIAKSTPPALQIILSPGAVECSAQGGGDRIVIDVGRDSAGQFTVVLGHPYASFLSDGQARAEVCPTGDPGQQAPCHTQVRGGTVKIDRLDPGAGGLVEGTFTVDLSDGSVSGTFSAVRCS